MLEAVNSVLQSAPFVRANAEQTSTADSFAANPDRVQRTAPQAPYISPYIHVDVYNDKAVLQIRDSDTGDVLQQYPSERTMQVRQQQEASQALLQKNVEQQASQPAPQQQQARDPGREAPVAVAAVQTFEANTPAPQPVKKSATPKQIAAFVSAANSGSSSGASSGAVALSA